MKNKLTLLFIVLVTLSSCGVITKARYGNGLKINLDFGKNSEKNVTSNPSKVKRKSIPKTQNIQNQVEETFLSSIENTSTISTFTKFENETTQTKTNTMINQFPKKPILDKIEKKKEIIKTYIKPNQAKMTNDDRPFERNAKWGGILFYGGLLLALLTPFLFAFFGLAGLLLCSYSLGVIKTSNYAYRGYGLAKSVLIIYLALLVIALLLIGALIASF
jgi:hypothetical protein